MAAVSNSTSLPSGDGTPPSGPDLTGRTIGDFQIIRRLGRGGMAEVYLAEQTSLKRQVAIKVLREEYVADATYVKRFRHEATAAGALNHPNIVQVYSIGEHEGIHFIAQEYVRGGNLKEFLRKKGPLECPVAIFLMKQVAAALQVAGSNGIVHRDIKPENILLTKKGEAKVADFGLAQLTQKGERVNLTQVGVTMGTPLYMSPEQVAGKALDHRSDIYSFGAMAYHMLAGRPPFQGANALAIAVQHLNEKAEPLNKIRPDLPPAVCAAVHKMMAKKPEDRFADAQALLNELKTLQKQLISKDGTLASGTPARRLSASRSLSIGPLGRASFRRQMWMLLSSGVAVVTISAGIGWTQRVGDPFEVAAQPAPNMVPKQPTIDGQYFYAMLHGEDEAAWRAVVEYPTGADGRTDEMPRQIAELRLAILYLQQDRLPEAEKIFESFVRLGTTNQWKLYNGLAGRAILQNIRGQTAASQTTINGIPAEASLDAKLKPLFEEARKRNLG